MKIEIEVDAPIMEFNCFEEWTKTKAMQFEQNNIKNRRFIIMVDSVGRVVVNDYDIVVAAKEKTFPVRVYRL